jgi:GntR family transcriptional repressor for pyruvate dehydrogenase complex
MGPKSEDQIIEKTLPVKPVQKKSVPQQVIHQIKSLIEAGHIKPGSRLPGERELSQMMKVSRPSLREALHVLSLLGIIENCPGSGTYLTSSSEGWPVEPISILFLLKKGTLMDIFEARKILEGGVAALAASHRSDEDLEAMEEALKGMQLNLESPKKYAKYELEFHRANIGAAGNLVIADLVEKLYKLLSDTKTRVYRRYTSRIRSYRKQDYRNHEVIFHYIKAGDEQMAARAMVDHLVDFEKMLKDEETMGKRAPP